MSHLSYMALPPKWSGTGVFGHKGAAGQTVHHSCCSYHNAVPFMVVFFVLWQMAATLWGWVSLQ